MAQRLELQALLEELAPHVYFQPPESSAMEYPCIVYSRSRDQRRFADNIPYWMKMRYTVTVIDRDPDSLIPAKVGKLPMCVYDRFFAVDDLNHDVYMLFF